MHKHKFTINIQASKESVWSALWDDTTFRDWAGIIDEGTYIEGELREGNKIQFISSVNGYGVTSYIEKITPNEYILFKHMKDTKGHGTEVRDDEWTGGSDSYTLTEHNGTTTLIVEMDLPREQEELFNIRVPQTLERIKVLAEGKE